MFLLGMVVGVAAPRAVLVSLLTGPLIGEPFPCLGQGEELVALLAGIETPGEIAALFRVLPVFFGFLHPWASFGRSIRRAAPFEPGGSKDASKKLQPAGVVMGAPPWIDRFIVLNTAGPSP
jgi:hypothetical protein